MCILLWAGLIFFLLEDFLYRMFSIGSLRSLIINSFKTGKEDYEAYLQGRKIW